jgi:hypothetical protein
MEKDYLVLRRASASRLSGEWNDDDFDVLADGEAVGRIFNPWMSRWQLILCFAIFSDQISQSFHMIHPH